MPSTTDLITGVRDGTARPVATTVTASRSAGGTTLQVAATTGWDTTTKVHFQTYTTDAQGNKVTASATDWSGIVSGTTITNLQVTAGTDNGNAIGDTVECMPTAGWADELAQGLLLEHEPDGTHDNTKVAMLAGNQTFTGNKTFNGTVTLPNNSVDANEISTSAIKLGYAQATSTFSTSSTSPVQVTGLSTTVTIPAGGRSVKITVYSPQVGSGNPSWTATVSLWDGTVGSGTKISDASVVSPTAGIHSPVCLVAVVTPSAGSKTYNVGFQTTSPAVDFYGGANRPSFILVEAI